MDRYIRRHNVENFARRLENVKDESQRQMLLTLLAEERQKQNDAGDFVLAPKDVS